MLSWVNPRGLVACELIEAASVPYDLHRGMGSTPKGVPRQP